MAPPDGQNAAYIPAPAQPDETAATITPTRSGCLVNLIRKLIDCGNRVLALLQQPDATGNLEYIRRGMAFGTRDIALIIARITRGLMRASALEQRVTNNAAHIDRIRRAAPHRTARAPAQPTRRPAAQRRPSATETARALLARMPTEEEIAAEIRRRPIGEVIAEICSDLGITSRHPLWREIREAVSEHGGRFLGLFNDLKERTILLDGMTPEERLLPIGPPDWKAIRATIDKVAAWQPP